MVNILTNIPPDDNKEQKNQSVFHKLCLSSQQYAQASLNQQSQYGHTQQSEGSPTVRVPRMPLNNEINIIYDQNNMQPLLCLKENGQRDAEKCMAKLNQKSDYLNKRVSEIQKKYEIQDQEDSRQLMVFKQQFQNTIHMKSKKNGNKRSRGSKAAFLQIRSLQNHPMRASKPQKQSELYKSTLREKEDLGHDNKISPGRYSDTEQWRNAQMIIDQIKNLDEGTLTNHDMLTPQVMQDTTNQNSCLSKPDIQYKNEQPPQNLDQNQNYGLDDRKCSFMNKVKSVRSSTDGEEDLVVMSMERDKNASKYFGPETLLASANVGSPRDQNTTLRSDQQENVLRTPKTRQSGDKEGKSKSSKKDLTPSRSLVYANRTPSKNTQNSKMRYNETSKSRETISKLSPVQSRQMQIKQQYPGLQKEILNNDLPEYENKNGQQSSQRAIQINIHENEGPSDSAGLVKTFYSQQPHTTKNNTVSESLKSSYAKKWKFLRKDHPGVKQKGKVYETVQEKVKTRIQRHFGGGNGQPQVNKVLSASQNIRIQSELGNKKLKRLRQNHNIVSSSCSNQEVLNSTVVQEEKQMGSKLPIQYTDYNLTSLLNLTSPTGSEKAHNVQNITFKSNPTSPQGYYPPCPQKSQFRRLKTAKTTKHSRVNTTIMNKSAVWSPSGNQDQFNATNPLPQQYCKIKVTPAHSTMSGHENIVWAQAPTIMVGQDLIIEARQRQERSMANIRKCHHSSMVAKSMKRMMIKESSQAMQKNWVNEEREEQRFVCHPDRQSAIQSFLKRFGNQRQSTKISYKAQLDRQEQNKSTNFTPLDDHEKIEQPESLKVSQLFENIHMRHTFTKSSGSPKRFNMKQRKNVNNRYDIQLRGSQPLVLNGGDLSNMSRMTTHKHDDSLSSPLSSKVPTMEMMGRLSQQQANIKGAVLPVYSSISNENNNLQSSSQDDEKCGLGTQGPPLQNSLNQSYHASQNYLSPINVKWTNAESKPLVKVVQEQMLKYPDDGQKPDTLANSNISSVTGRGRNNSKVVAGIESQRSQNYKLKLDEILNFEGDHESPEAIAPKSDPRAGISIAEPEEDETHVKSLSYDNTSPNFNVAINPNPSGVLREGEQADRQLNCDMVENLLQLQEQYTMDYQTKIGTMYEHDNLNQQLGQQEINDELIQQMENSEGQFSPVVENIENQNEQGEARNKRKQQVNPGEILGEKYQLRDQVIRHNQNMKSAQLQPYQKQSVNQKKLNEDLCEVRKVNNRSKQSSIIADRNSSKSSQYMRMNQLQLHQFAKSRSGLSYHPIQSVLQKNLEGDQQYSMSDIQGSPLLVRNPNSIPPIILEDKDLNRTEENQNSPKTHLPRGSPENERESEEVSSLKDVLINVQARFCPQHSQGSSNIYGTVNSNKANCQLCQDMNYSQNGQQKLKDPNIAGSFHTVLLSGGNFGGRASQQGSVVTQMRDVATGGGSQMYAPAAEANNINPVVIRTNTVSGEGVPLKTVPESSLQNSTIQSNEHSNVIIVGLQDGQIQAIQGYKMQFDHASGQNLHYFDMQAMDQLIQSQTGKKQMKLKQFECPLPEAVGQTGQEGSTISSQGPIRFQKGCELPIQNSRLRYAFPQQKKYQHKSMVKFGIGSPTSTSLSHDKNKSPSPGPDKDLTITSTTNLNTLKQNVDLSYARYLKQYNEQMASAKVSSPRSQIELFMNSSNNKNRPAQVDQNVQVYTSCALVQEETECSPRTVKRQYPSQFQSLQNPNTPGTAAFREKNISSVRDQQSSPESPSFNKNATKSKDKDSEQISIQRLIEVQELVDQNKSNDLSEFSSPTVVNITTRPPKQKSIVTLNLAPTSNQTSQLQHCHEDLQPQYNNKFKKMIQMKIDKTAIIKSGVYKINSKKIQKLHLESLKNKNFVDHIYNNDQSPGNIDDDLALNFSPTSILVDTQRALQKDIRQSNSDIRALTAGRRSKQNKRMRTKTSQQISSGSFGVIQPQLQAHEPIGLTQQDNLPLIIHSMANQRRHSVSQGDGPGNESAQQARQTDPKVINHLPEVAEQPALQRDEIDNFIQQNQDLEEFLQVAQEIELSNDNTQNIPSHRSAKFKIQATDGTHDSLQSAPQKR